MVGDLSQWLTLVIAGVVHQHVESTGLADGRVHQAIRRSRFAQIVADEDRGWLWWRHRTMMMSHYTCAGGGELFDNRAANTPHAARDQNRLSGEIHYRTKEAMRWTNTPPTVIDGAKPYSASAGERASS